MDERGYESITRPASGDQRQCKRVRRLGIPTWAIKEDSYFPGLLIAMYGPTGRKVLTWVETTAPVPDREEAPEIRQPEGSNQQARCASSEHVGDRRSHRRVVGHRRGQEGRFTTSRGICAISLTGVYNWRSHLGTLGDWEDVLLEVAAS